MNRDDSVLKQKSADLVALSSRLLEVLEQAKMEASQTKDVLQRQYRLDWVTVAIGNISSYCDQVAVSLRKKDLRGLQYASGELSVVGRYLNDYDYSWFSAHGELSTVIAALHKTAASLVVAIGI